MQSLRFASIFPAIAALALLTGGCVSTGKAPNVVTRVKATEAALAAGEATLEINRRPGTLWFYVAAVDGPKGHQEVALTPVEGFYRLQPGLNTLTVRTLVNDYRALPPDAEAPGATLHLLAVPGVAYTLSGTEDGKALTFSIVERNTLRTVVDGVTLPIFRPAPVDSIHRWDPAYVPGPDAPPAPR